MSFNREAERILGILRTPGHPVEQLLGVLTIRRADGTEFSLEQFPLAQVLATSETVRAEEIVMAVPDGRSITVLINATPIRSEEGEVVSVVVTLQDMTALEDQERLRAEFLAMVSHEDEEFLDVALDAPAKLALDSRRVRQERAADGQQLPLPGQLGNPPLRWLVMVAGFGCDIELVDCRGPSGQCGVFGVAGSLVVDVPQQVRPAPLLGAIIMMVGSVEIADQYSGESIAQRLVHDCFAPTPPQEVAFGGGAESPHVAVGPALTPAGFVGVDHWAGADAVQDRGHCRLGPLRRAMDGAHDVPHAEAQLMHGV